MARGPFVYSLENRCFIISTDILIIFFSFRRARYLATEPMVGFLQTLKRNCPGLSHIKVCIADKIPVPVEKVKVHM